MLTVIGAEDRYVGQNLSELLTELGLRSIRTIKVDRIIKEIKQPDRLIIVDMNWELIQERGVLRQIVNIGKISGNQVLCLCPNTDEDLKKMAKQARPAEVFIRYDTHTRFKEYIREHAATISQREE